LDTTLFTYEPDYPMDDEYEVIFEDGMYNIVRYTVFNPRIETFETTYIPRKGNAEYSRTQRINRKSVSFKSVDAAKKFLTEQVQ